MQTTRKTKFLDPTGKQVIALTGGIGSGKSFALNCFAKLGFAIISADKIVHELLQRGGEAFAQVALLAPEAVSDNSIDRSILGAKAFADSAFLSNLEQILHPLVNLRLSEKAAQTRASGSRQSLVCEIPLLFQAQMENDYDATLLTICHPDKQRQRALARKSMTEGKLSAIIAKQEDYQQYIERCDWVLNTDGTELSTYRQICGFLR